MYLVGAGSNHAFQTVSGSKVDPDGEGACRARWQLYVVGGFVACCSDPTGK